MSHALVELLHLVIRNPPSSLHSVFLYYFASFVFVCGYYVLNARDFVWISSWVTSAYDLRCHDGVAPGM